MALAQPTNLQVQTLEPLITVEQDVWRYVSGDCGLLTESGDALITESGDTLEAQPCMIPLLTLNQYVDADTATLTPAGEIVGVTQVVDDSAVIRPAAELVTVWQLVDDSAAIRPAQTLAALDQTIITELEQPRQTLVSVAQEVERHLPTLTLVKARQSVLSAAVAQEITTLVLLDDADITDQCSPAIDITASEGDNRTATVVLYPGSGPISITSYQGRDVEIHRRIGGTWQALFVGVVDVPTYRRDSSSLQLRCSDLRGERLGKEGQSRLMAMTGGAYSDVTQREDAEGEQWVRELMKTVEGSLDYTGSGSLRYRPWAVTTPRYTLQAGDIHHREVSLEFATRSEIVNRVPISVAFRWFKRHTFEAEVRAGVSTSTYEKNGRRLPAGDQTLPTKQAALSAAYSISNWQVLTATAGSPPESGWYRDSSSAFVDRAQYSSTDVFRDTYATGISASLVRYVSQGMRWTDEIIVEAPQSIDQFEEIEGSSISLSIDTEIDPGVFEEAGCYSKPEQDRLADREQAIDIAQRMAAKQIRGSHRNNYASARYKPKGGDLLPVEIGDTISVTTDEVTVIGWASEIRHATTVQGDAYTDIKLAVSRVDSALSVTDNLAVPAVGTPNKTNPSAQRSEPTVCGPAPEDEEDAPTSSDIAKDGSITLVAPAIPAAQTDELVGEAEHSYQIAIPVNQFTVEVP